MVQTPSLRKLPSVDRVLQRPEVQSLFDDYGRVLVTEAVRLSLQALRDSMVLHEQAEPEEASFVRAVKQRLADLTSPSLKLVFNLSGTVLHTNLGRSALPSEALSAICDVAAGASNLEFDLDTGRRGDRNRHVEAWLCRLTGAEAALVVNNNAAAVLLALNSLALRKRVPVSRGELIEIGGAFRMPDIMSRAGCKLVEVGTTNRTHLADYERAIDAKTALLMKVHTSNYEVQGFTASVAETELARLAHTNGLPFLVDLGSGTLIELGRYGLPPEPTVQATLEAGADLVTFSGDKLLGGPQAGIVAGRAEFIARLKRNPLMRALRVDKLTLAALGAVLALYTDPERLIQRLPSLRLMARSVREIEALARRLVPVLAARVGAHVSVEAVACRSQVGSGALPVERLPSFALQLTPKGPKRARDRALRQLAAAFRALEVPVIGRIHDGALIFDLRCLEDEAAFVAQLDALALP